MNELHEEPSCLQRAEGSSGLLSTKLTSSSFDLDQTEREHNAWLRSRTICSDCQSILDLLHREWERTEANSILSTNHNCSALPSSAQHCPLCQLFLTDFNSHCFQEADIEAWGDRDIVASPIRWPNTDLRGIRLETWDPRTREILEIASLHLWAPVGNEAVAQQASRATDCARSWEVSKRWLAECMKSHPTCQRAIMPGTLPTRLLDVGTNGHELHLCLSKDLPEDTKYLTPSHCRGSMRFLTLTRNNLESFFESIPFKTLSKTCRDAITSTRRLNFRYLWVDSLCIIQGDHKDWVNEAATMGTVYANSVLNLAAIDSPDSDTGLFFQRLENRLLGWRFKVPLEREQGVPYEESVWDCVPARRRESFNNNVLTARAWVFQERFLAPRNMYFGMDELSWECRTRSTYEASPFDDQSLVRDGSLPFHNALADITNSATQWFQILKHYSKGRLTVESDKLTALSGVAKLFALES